MNVLLLTMDVKTSALTLTGPIPVVVVMDINGQTCSVSCGGILTEDSGTFQTPGWPIDYPQESHSI